MIRLLEELSFNAWPAMRTVYYDGWMLRFADGYTLRANSISPVYGSTIDLARKIEHAEALYSAQGLATIYKISPAAQPEGLDHELNSREYAVDTVTSVQTFDLRRLPQSNSAGIGVIIRNHPDTTWFDAYCRLNSIPDIHHEVVTRTVSAIVPRAIFAAITYGTEVIAVGSAIREREYMGIYDVATASDWRGQGLATRLVNSLLNWGRRDGATYAYLQVVAKNAPAMALYRRQGFTEVYRYWYRTRPLNLEAPR